MMCIDLFIMDIVVFVMVYFIVVNFVCSDSLFFVLLYFFVIWYKKMWVCISLSFNFLINFLIFGNKLIEWFKLFGLYDFVNWIV